MCLGNAFVLARCRVCHSRHMPIGDAHVAGIVVTVFAVVLLVLCAIEAVWRRGRLKSRIVTVEGVVESVRLLSTVRKPADVDGTSRRVCSWESICSFEDEDGNHRVVRKTVTGGDTQPWFEGDVCKVSYDAAHLDREPVVGDDMPDLVSTRGPLLAIVVVGLVLLVAGLFCLLGPFS